MDHRSMSPIHGRSPSKVDDEELPPVLQSTELLVDPDSASDDIPLRRRRPLRMISNDREDSHDLRDRRQHKNHVRKINDASLPEQRHAAHQATLRNSPKITSKSSGKIHKKPGPQPWASKPIKKNDLEAKKEVIREIEGYWGKGFTKTYIPKCHRPLIKRGKAGKRAMYRDHETDPKKWLPSVLKSILSLAKLTQNKAWLKKAMNDVVRYRIKNTGNRKPQLVTTDFDVLEDMLVKDWDVPYSFSIRYKHLLVNRQGQQETDEDIDHIFGQDSDGEGSFDGEADVEDEDADMDYNNDRDEEGEENGDDSEEEMSRGGLSGQYLHTSGYSGAAQHPPPYPVPGPPARKQNVKKEGSSKRSTELQSRPQPPPHNMENHGDNGRLYPYGLPVDPWGRPVPYSAGPHGFWGYGGYGMYGGYGAHSSSAANNGCHSSQPPGYYGMNPYPPHQSINPVPSQPNINRADRKHSRGPSVGSNIHMRSEFDHPAFHPGHPGFHPYGYPQNLHSGQSEVKEESPELELHGDGREAVDEIEGPEDEIGEDSNAAAVEAELRATELELKVARLQAKRAALNRQSTGK